MKYYVDAEIKKECYIKEIHVNENDIKVDYANGKTEVLPYSKETEESLKNKMDKQKDSYLKNVDDKVSFAKICYPAVALLILLVVSNLVPAASLFAMYTGLAIGAFVLPYTVIKQLKVNNKKKLELSTVIMKKDEETKKNTVEELQKAKHNGLSRKAKKIIKANTDYNRDPLTLNDLDKYSMLDLYIIRDEANNIERNKTLVKTSDKKGITM